MIKKQKNMIILFMCLVAFVTTMTVPFQGIIAHAALPNSSNLINSIDYSGLGTKINGEKTGDPAYITTKSVYGINQQVVAVPIYQGGYKTKGLWSSWSDWRIISFNENVSERFARASDGNIHYFQFETKTEYEWVRKGKLQWSFNRPVAIFPKYEQTGNSRTMVRHRSKKAVWDARLNTEEEYVPLNYSLYKNGKPIALALKFEHSNREQYFLNIINEKIITYYITNIELAKLIQSDIENFEDGIGFLSNFFKIGESISTIIAAIKGGAKVAGPLALLFACLEVNDIFRAYLREKDINDAQTLIKAILESPSTVFSISHYYSSTTTNTITNGSITTFINSQSLTSYDKTYVKLPNVNGKVSYINDQQEIIDAVINYLVYNHMPILPWNW